MNRREFIGGVAIAVLAGCLGGDQQRSTETVSPAPTETFETETTTTPTSTATETPTPTSTSTPTSTESPTPSPTSTFSPTPTPERSTEVVFAGIVDRETHEDLHEIASDRYPEVRIKVDYLCDDEGRVHFSNRLTIFGPNGSEVYSDDSSTDGPIESPPCDSPEGSSVWVWEINLPGVEWEVGIQTVDATVINEITGEKIEIEFTFEVVE